MLSAEEARNLESDNVVNARPNEYRSITLFSFPECKYEPETSPGTIPVLTY